MHHECVFHALQWAQRLVKEVYGNEYAQTHPEAVTLKEQIYHIFKAKSKKTVHKRYRKVMALREEYIAQMPEAQRIPSTGSGQASISWNITTPNWSTLWRTLSPH